ncbi:MAG TPA: phosphotransferase [Roseiflexaceae bacterium]|nr:phosphotransferase [Roseiflexaceae bacterium]
MAAQLDVDLLDAWDIGPVLHAQQPATGTINQTWLITTTKGRYVLRAYRHRERLPVEREHAIIAYAVAHGMPAVAPLPQPNGTTILEQEGCFYALFPHAPGKQFARADLGEREFAAMGHCLADLHGALKEYPAECVAQRSLHVDATATFAAIERLEAAIHAKSLFDETDQIVLRRLARRRAWLEQNANLEAPNLNALPWQVIHGDYQEANLFFEDGQVSAIIDWDQAYVAPRAWEVARTLHLALKFETAACQTFLAAYRALLPLPPDEIDMAMNCYSWMRAHDLWIYEALYFEQNQRVRQYITPGTFRPLVERWNTLKSFL